MAALKYMYEIGNVIGDLILIKQLPNNRYYKRVFLCKCICGNEKEISVTSLINGTKSCGCLHKKTVKITSTKHNLCHSKEYYSYNNMKSRCYNSNNNHYMYYGGRGIKVCDRWLENFDNFYKDMGRKPTPQHSIERGDVNGNYEPSNCRWATIKEQSNNKRTTKKYVYQNVEYTIDKLSDILLVPSKKIYGFLKTHSIEELFIKYK